MFKISKQEIRDVREGTVSEELLERAIEFTMTNGEMPYGVQKARTGDPYTWVSDWLCKNFDKETK
jgi:hypothetical protein